MFHLILLDPALRKIMETVLRNRERISHQILINFEPLWWAKAPHTKHKAPPRPGLLPVYKKNLFFLVFEYKPRDMPLGRLIKYPTNPIMSNEQQKQIAEVTELTALPSTMDSVTARPAGEVPMDSGLIEGMSDGQEHALKAFLARPTIVSIGTWTSVAPANGILAAIYLPETIILASKALSQKISGFLGFRAKCVIRLQVNTNRFQQGRLLMNFFPQDNFMSRKYYTTITSLMYQTQLPRIDFDAATDTEVILEVPYVGPYLAYDTTDGTGHVGVVNLIVYEPLQASSGELSAEYTIWAHFEDVELLYPTVSNTAYVPQAGGSRKMRVGGDHSEAEARDPDGPVSGILMKVSRVADVLGEIPLLASVAKPTSWISSILSHTAAAFGFANPSNFAQACLYQQRTFAKAINVSGVDNSINMALLEDNHIRTLPSFASSGHDEMAFMHALSIPTWFRTITWTDTAVPFASLFAIQLLPINFREARGAVGFNTTPITYIGNFFRYYRGSFRFRIKLVKTEFHSGRMAISFTPGYTAAAHVMTEAELPFVHKEIVDIRATTEIEFVCPWVSTTPMLRTTASYGTLNINVINELRHPDTVPNSISLIIEVSTADDFQFAVPDNTALFPVLWGTNGTPQCGEAHPQAGEILVGQIDQHSQVKEVVDPIGSAEKHTPLNFSAAEYAIGELITSFRQLCKRATPHFDSTSIAATYNRSYIYAHENVMPIYNDTTSTWSTVGAFYPDYLSATMNCFAFIRGSVRYRVYSKDVTSDNDISRISLATADDYPGSTYSGFVSSASAWVKETFMPVVPAPTTVYPNPEISIPYYNNFTQYPVCTDTSGSTPNQSFRPDKWLSIQHSIGAEFIITRQAGDDFSAGLWVGSCPLAYPEIVAPPATHNNPW